jgi:hypothetical protein
LDAPVPTGRATPSKGRWGWGNSDDHHGAQVEMSAPAERISLQDLYPPRRRGTGLRQKDDGGGLTDLGNGSDMSEKNYRCKSYTPLPRPQRDSGSGRSGHPLDSEFRPYRETSSRRRPDRSWTGASAYRYTQGLLHSRRSLAPSPAGSIAGIFAKFWRKWSIWRNQRL